MTPHLLVISIGPVQDFIASARRTRDLWFGSWLLSEVSKAVAHSLNSQHPGCLIFPNPPNAHDLNPNSDLSVANVVLAHVNYPQETAHKATQAAKQRLLEVWQGAQAHIKGPIDNQVALQQIQDMLEVQWAAYPYPQDTPQAYAHSRQQLYRYLAARKATRGFAPVAWGDTKPKSSLDGLRESVIPEDAFNSNSPEQLRTKYGVRRGERLCAVGLLKRHGHKKDQPYFASTSHVAAQPMLSAMRYKPHAKPALEKYVAALQQLGLSESELKSLPVSHEVMGRIDAYVLFENRLADYISEEAKHKQAQEALKTFLREASLKPPMPYYVLLWADGDFMGQTIDHLSQQGKQAHQKFSQVLARFSIHATAIVQKHQGSLVYAGGDDVLAFLPLHTALECGLELQEAFAKLLSDNFERLDPAPSLSGGMVVYHHTDPLDEALELVRQGERHAKSIEGKNGLAIIVSKRSGASYIIKDKWSELTQRLHEFIQMYDHQALPHGAPYELRQLAHELQHLPQAVLGEFGRILNRKTTADGAKMLRESKGAITRYFTELSQNRAKTKEALEELAHELIAARLFWQGRRLSQPISKGDNP